MGTQDFRIDFSKIYSPYKLGMFRQCPQEYYFSYLSPIYSKLKYELQRLPQNIWFFYTIGKAVHDAITLFYYLPVEERNEASLLQGLSKTWRSEAMWQKKPPLGKWGGFPEGDPEAERAAYRKALQMLKNFLGKADCQPTIRFLPTNDFKKSIEDYKSFITPLSGDVFISGRFDLVVDFPDNLLQVIDYKTSKTSKVDQNQALFYKALAELHFGQPVRKVSFFFLESGEVIEESMEDKIADDIKSDLLKQIESIKSTEEFVPRPSKLCRYCLFKSFCPAKKEVDDLLKEPINQEEIPSDLPF